MIDITPIEGNNMTTIDLVSKALNLTNDELLENKQYIDLLIKGASNYIEQYTGRVYNYSDVIEKLPGNGQLNIYVSVRPIKELVEIKIFDTVIDPSLYEIDNPNTGSIYKETVWVDYTKYHGYIEKQPAMSKHAYTITYKAGYYMPGSNQRDFPYDLEIACIELVKHLYHSKDRNYLVSREVIGDAQRTFATIGSVGVPDMVTEILDKWKAF